MALVVGGCYAQPMHVQATAPVQLPFGLFSVSDIVEPNDPHWQTGIEFEPYRCGPASVYPCPTCDQAAGTAAGTSKTYTAGIPLQQAFPFTVYGSFSCSPVSNWDEGEARARQHLLTGRERAVEGEIALGNNHGGAELTGTASVDVTPTPGTPVTVAQGVALLEQYIGAVGLGQGVVLGARRDVLLAASVRTVVEPTPGQQTLYTMLNTPIAALSGFDGRTGPNKVAAAAGAAWLFGIGSRPQIRRSAIFTSPRAQSLDTRFNNYRVLAEQTYVVSWDPCVTAGVLVTSI